MSEPQSTKYERALFQAISEKNIEATLWLINTDDLDINTRDVNNRTPLHIAVKSGLLNIVMCLIARGADVSAIDIDSWTPLHNASYEGYNDIVDQLIDSGASFNAKDKDNMLPIHLAAFAGHATVVKTLIRKGCKIDVKANHGWLPLHMAASNGHLGVLKILYENGAQLDAYKSPQGTSLHLAVREGHVNVVKYLLENGANVNIKDNNSRKPIEVAKHPTIRELLISKASAPPPPGSQASSNSLKSSKGSKISKISKITSNIKRKVSLDSSSSKSPKRKGSNPLLPSASSLPPAPDPPTITQSSSSLPSSSPLHSLTPPPSKPLPQIPTGLAKPSNNNNISNNSNNNSGGGGGGGGVRKATINDLPKLTMVQVNQIEEIPTAQVVHSVQEYSFAPVIMQVLDDDDGDDNQNNSSSNNNRSSNNIDLIPQIYSSNENEKIEALLLDLIPRGSTIKRVDEALSALVSGNEEFFVNLVDFSDEISSETSELLRSTISRNFQQLLSRMENTSSAIHISSTLKRIAQPKPTTSPLDQIFIEMNSSKSQNGRNNNNNNNERNGNIMIGNNNSNGNAKRRNNNNVEGSESEDEEEEEVIPVKVPKVGIEKDMEDAEEIANWLKNSMSQNNEKLAIKFYVALYPRFVSFRRLMKISKNDVHPALPSLIKQIQLLLNKCEDNYGGMLPCIDCGVDDVIEEDDEFQLSSDDDDDAFGF